MNSTRDTRKPGMESATILVVDDIDDWCYVMQEELVTAGYQCETANSYDQAIEKLKHGNIDIAVLDMRLNEIDEEDKSGLDILDWIVTTGGNQKVILVTGYATSESLAAAVRTGKVADFLEKGVISKLLSCIKNIVDKG